MEKKVKFNYIIKKYYYGTEKDSPKILRQKEIFNRKINERYDEATKINSNNLIYHFKSKNRFKHFNDFDNVFSLMEKIKNKSKKKSKRA